MRLNPVVTEVTTAGTDALLGVLCVSVLWSLRGSGQAWPRAIWMAVFALMAVSSLLGSVVHGLELPERTRFFLWQPLYLSLGVMIALVVVAGVYDWRGEASARALLPWALAVGVGFYGVTIGTGGGFVAFIAYEAAAMIAVLALYATLWSRGAPGTGFIALGIGLSLAAAVVQTTRLRTSIVVPLDHNGIFHVVQMLATGVLAAGVHAALHAQP